MSDLNNIAAAVKSARDGEIEAAMTSIMGLSSIEDVGSVAVELESLKNATSSASVQYTLGHCHSWLGNHNAAMSYFEKAGISGMSAGYYRAALSLYQVLGESAESESRYLWLLEEAKKHGHVWGTIRLLRLQSRHSLLRYLDFLAYRFLVAPVKIIFTSILINNKDSIRY